MGKRIPIEKEYDVKVSFSCGVIAESREAAEQWLVDQFRDGNTNYTSEVEVENA